MAEYKKHNTQYTGQKSPKTKSLITYYNGNDAPLHAENDCSDNVVKYRKQKHYYIKNYAGKRPSILV